MNVLQAVARMYNKAKTIEQKNWLSNFIYIKIEDLISNCILI